MKKSRLLTRRLNGFILAVVMIVGFVLSVPASATDAGAAFKDVPDGKWFSEAVKYCYLRGYVGGYSDNTFRPDNKLTRAEMAVIMSNVFEMPEKAANTFKDVQEGKWYTDAVLRCVKAGVMSGYNKDTFGVNDNLNREQGAVILARVFGVDKVSGRTSFADDASISSWAVESVKGMTQKKLLSGMGNNKFSPKTPMTRAQMCQIIYAEAGKPSLDRIWKDAYMEWLQTSDETKNNWKELRYTLAYVDGDDIPELFIYSEDREAFSHVLSYQTGTVNILHLDETAIVDVYVAEKDNRVWLAYYGDDVFFNDQIWSINAKKGWEKIAEGTYNESLTERDEEGYPVIENIKWDGKSVDVYTYFDTIKSYIGAEDPDYLETTMDGKQLEEKLK